MSDDNLVKFGANIKRLRLALGMSQDELAEKCGYTSRSSIAKIETGATDIPQAKIKLFADALHVKPGDILAAAPVNPQPQYIIEIEELARDMSESQQARLLEYAKMLLKFGDGD